MNPLKLLRFIDLPENLRDAEEPFDHATVLTSSDTLFIAHTANDSVELVDLKQERHVATVDGATAISGVTSVEGIDLVFTANRGDNTIGIIEGADPKTLTKFAVGNRPNGLAFDSKRGKLLVANTGKNAAGAYSACLFDTVNRKLLSEIPLPGRTRWAVNDPKSGFFFINIGDPALIAVVNPTHLSKVDRLIEVPGKGPHGLDIDPINGVLYCACDSGTLVALDVETGKVLAQATLSGTPDVIFFNPATKHIYAAIGDPGVLDVIRVNSRYEMARLSSVETEFGAISLAMDTKRNRVYSILPHSHRLGVYQDQI
jgi:DNA-binding beta-propeller fold protein YncE